MEPLTLEWKGETLISHLTDADAATACERIPADSKSYAFARSLVADFRRYGSLFPNKRFWLHDLALGQLEREVPAESSAAPGGMLSRIAAFLTPASARLKSGARVTFTSGELTVCIKRAGESSRWPGSFYVNGLTGFGDSGSVYAGRIAPDGGFFPTNACDPAILALLDEFEENPAEYAMRYGQRTGNCCFCALKLDDPISVGLGYGRVCAGHYSLPYGKKALASALKMRCEAVA